MIILMDMNQIKDIFFQECDEQLTELENGLVKMQSGDHQTETVNAVFRAVHSIKGGAGAFGMDDLVIFAHAFETTLDCIRSQKLYPSFDVLKLMLKSADVLADLTDAAKKSIPVEPGCFSAIAKELGQLSNGPQLGSTNDFENVLEVSAVEFPADAGRSGGEQEIKTVPPEHEYQEVEHQTVSQQGLATVAFINETEKSLELIDSLENLSPRRLEASQNSPAREATLARNSGSEVASVNSTAVIGATIRVDLDRVDRLINLVGELVINQAMLSQSVYDSEQKNMSAMDNGLDELQQLTREIQDSVMAIRAQPVKPVFQRMARIVRDIAEVTGKDVRLITEGENTEVDKTVIDKLAEPLTHMIRNAVDHGLETPQMRLAIGKKAEGTVRLTAKHRSGRIVIELSDDGAGINRAKVRQKALENNLIAADANLAEDELDNLIFHPGFSTADKISDISGRGVGMDVVKRSIQALGGRITISSKPGQGSTFTMSLPLTLAVLDGMVVTVAGQTLVVPLTAIVETLQPQAVSIHSFGATQRLISIRNSFTPLIDVGQILNFRTTQTDPTVGVALLVESESGGQRALIVDFIQGQRQVVIKSLEANYAHIPGIAAATILGDGRVALILDVDAVIASSQTQNIVQKSNILASSALA